MAEFAIRVAEVSDEVVSKVFAVRPEWLDSVLQGTDIKAKPESTGKLSIDVYQAGDDVIARGRASAALLVPCSRCLTDLAIEVSAELSLVMAEGPPEDGADGDVELSDDELGREYFSGEEIDFDDIVRDHLLLEIPMQTRCVDPPCPEWVKEYLTTAEEAEALAKEQAAEKKPDPRFAALAKLKGKIKSKLE